MPRRQSKVGIASIPQQPEFAVSEADWLLIESNYGHSLSNDIRDQIATVTQGFCLLAAGECLAPPTIDARKAARRILTIAKTLMDAMTPPSEINGRFYALHLIRNFIRDEKLPDPTVLPFQDPVSSFASMLASLVAACEQSLRELHNPERAEIKVGMAWDSWICDLVKILERKGLPVSARKDCDKRTNNTLSEFVALISALQKLLPPRCRRTCSASGVETAINRAKRRLAGQ